VFETPKLKEQQKRKEKEDDLLKEGEKPLKPPYFQTLYLLHFLSILKN
jgi:hypothetical protein